MTNFDRFRLLFGPYKSPRFKYGDIVMDEARDCEVIVVDISDARIPWPIGRRRETSARALIVYGKQANAVRQESNQAVCYWWSVTPQTVTKWRKALGVEPTNRGTSRFRSDNAHEAPAVQGLKKAITKAADPERRAKIAAAKKGKKRPRHVIEAMRRARQGTRHTEAARRKMSEAQRRRGARPPKAARPWTAEEDAIVMTLPASEVAKRTGRTMRAVYSRRSALKVTGEAAE